MPDVHDMSERLMRVSSNHESIMHLDPRMQQDADREFVATGVVSLIVPSIGPRNGCYPGDPG